LWPVSSSARDAGLPESAGGHAGAARSGAGGHGGEQRDAATHIFADGPAVPAAELRLSLDDVSAPAVGFPERRLDWKAIHPLTHP
jgi:hypothetical protein